MASRNFGAARLRCTAILDKTIVLAHARSRNLALHSPSRFLAHPWRTRPTFLAVIPIIERAQVNGVIHNAQCDHRESDNRCVGFQVAAKCAIWIGERDID